MSGLTQLAIVNARVRTNDPRRPWVDAILISASCVEALGSSAEIKKRSRTGGVTVNAERRLVVSADGADAVIGVGGLASFLILDADAVPIGDASDLTSRIVLRVEAGAVVYDRDGLVLS